uniref:NADH dehydrogenase [ubiquinone] 1 alpha subcomplex subunit 1 n=1 Tax=Steinernema glaseri TaxID=37863 RepID=A0A1I7ZB65_9BILA
MWYEQFYSGIITIAWVTGACVMSYPFNKLDVGRAFRRDYGSVNRIHLTQRDHRLTGNQYVLSGLESIPDGPK